MIPLSRTYTPSTPRYATRRHASVWSIKWYTWSGQTHSTWLWGTKKN